MLEKINCERQLINILDLRKLTFIGHQLRKGYTLEKTLLLGPVYGKRLRGRPKTRLSDNIKEICRLTMVETERKAQMRTGWRRFVQMATAVRQRTTLTNHPLMMMRYDSCRLNLLMILICDSLSTALYFIV